eukprot:m51a1_g7636 putative transmembrane protein (350) ;mRNA; f:334881-336075
MDFRQAVTGIPLGTKIISALVVVFAVLSFVVPTPEKFFAINPALTLPPSMRIWTIFTSSFFERSVITSVLDVVVTVVAGKYLETSWGTVELVRFVLTVATFSGLGALTLSTLAAVALRGSTVARRADICGYSGLLTAYLVAVKQLAPDMEHRLLLLGALRARHLPLLCVAVCAALSLVSRGFQALVMSLCGLGVAWAYLRYWQRRPGGAVGDRGESFAFHTFFPEAVQGPLAAAERLLSSLCCGRGGAGAGGASLAGSRAFAVAPAGSSAADIERRRVLALRAVDQRLAELKNAPDSVAVDIDAAQQPQQQQQQEAPAKAQTPPAAAAAAGEGSSPAPKAPSSGEQQTK